MNPVHNLSNSEGGRATIAVVGAGVAGLGAAWLLGKRHSVVLYERADRIGGHAHTVDVADPAGQIAIDTGFIVFNRPNYPHLSRLFEHLGVSTVPTSMSFSASIDDGTVEYAGTSLATLFAQPRNLLAPRFLGMLRDILRFNRAATRLVAEADDSRSLGAFLREGRYGEPFKNWYLLPMAAAIWSCPTAVMLDFPARSLACFFANHGLLGISDRPQWRSVVGGSRSYVRRLCDDLGGSIRAHTAARRVERDADGVTVHDVRGERRRFDHVVLACHADEALSLLAAPDAAERVLLGAFRYQPNRVVLHTDARLMPARKAVWSSWNYLGGRDVAGRRAVSVSYWMNLLQGLRAQRDYFVSLNPLREPATASVLGEYSYEHPVFDAAAMGAQAGLPGLQGQHRTWFCGSYHGYGFHEEAFGARAPWQDARPAAAAPVIDYPVPRGTPAAVVGAGQ